MNWQNPVERETEKRLRTVLAAFILAMLAALAILLILFPHRYTPQEAQSGTGGFIALRYSGVSLKPGNDAVTPARLREQLTALKDNGYMAVGTEQITAYLETGAPLPEKAVYLIFSDGRPETILLADRTLRALGFQAAFPPGPAANWDLTQMSVRERKERLESGFWTESLPEFSEESGTNRRAAALTWLRPGEEWGANHLLMRMAEARGEPFPSQEVSGWDSLSGCAAWDGEEITLTSPIGQPGIARLQIGGKYGDWHVKARFSGSTSGTQSLYLRADAKMQQFVCIRYANGLLTGVQRTNEQEDVLFSQSVKTGGIDVSLSGSELAVRQNGETVAWTRTTVRDEGYICLEAAPVEADSIYDGIFRVSVARPEGEKEREIYNSLRPARRALGILTSGWHAMWDWMRVSL